MAKTNHAITQSLQRALQQHAAPVAAIQMLASQDRSAVDMLLQQDHLIDVLIPRGGPQLIRHITENSRIPVFSHLQGLCHTYIHCEANLDMAVAVALNAKMRRPGICGATETLLVDAAIAEKFLPSLVPALLDAGCLIKGDQASQQIDSRIKPATEEDWSTEYLEAILSVHIVSDINQAIAHIHRYGSNHTEAIITAEQAAADQFCSEVSSAIVMHNCSTQFADGGEFGMGAEIGIATGNCTRADRLVWSSSPPLSTWLKGRGRPGLESWAAKTARLS